MAFFTGGVPWCGRSVPPVAGGRQCAARSRSLTHSAAILVGVLGLSGCSTLEGGPHAWFAAALGDTVPPADAAAATGQPTGPRDNDSTDSAHVISRYIGSVAADDPQVVEIGRRVLNSGGLAADAAAAMGMALTVSMPSRAGIDGSGVCLVHRGRTATVEEDDFIPPPVPGDVQIPGMVRGLADLQARYGVLRWQQSIGMAEQLGERGIAVTGTLLGDLIANGLSADGPGGVPLKVGDVLPQTSVAGALAELRVGGASDFYSGKSAEALVAAGVPASQLAAWLPTWRSATAEFVGDRPVYVSAGAAGQLAGSAIAALTSAQPANPGDAFAIVRGIATKSGITDAKMPTTSLVVVDGLGDGVACVFTMGKLFGTGDLIPDLDVYGAVAPSAATENALAPVIAISGQQLTLAAAGSSSGMAPLDLAAVWWLALDRERPIVTALTDARIPTEGIGSEANDHLNAVACTDGSPADAKDCVAAYDPRGSGYAVTADRFGGS